jgi:farnesyl diphosphate synthase
MEGVGNIAINDSFMLEAAIYHILRSHFRSEAYYVDIIDLFHEVRDLVRIYRLQLTLFHRSHIRRKWDN